jgi:hypothetical protein
VEITFLSFEGCPNAELARTRLVEAIERVDATSPDIRYVEVGMTDDVRKLGFRGSPTILFDGLDPFADEHTPFGFSCRIYRTQHSTEGSPSVEALVDALIQALS